MTQTHTHTHEFVGGTIHLYLLQLQSLPPACHLVSCQLIDFSSKWYPIFHLVCLFCFRFSTRKTFRDSYTHTHIERKRKDHLARGSMVDVTQTALKVTGCHWTELLFRCHQVWERKREREKEQVRGDFLGPSYLMLFFYTTHIEKE